MNNILVEGVGKATPIDPLSRKIFLQVQAPSLADNQGDVERVQKALKNEFGKVLVPLKLMSIIPSVCRVGDWRVTATVVVDSRGGWELVDLEPGNTVSAHYGLSIDIGTTTVVVYLVDMTSGEVVDSAAGYNGQARFGPDVLTRIFAAEAPEGEKDLKMAVVETLNRLIQEVAGRNNIATGLISAAAIGANNTMVHLLLGLDPSRIPVTPYVPVVNNPGLLTAGEVGLAINPLGVVYLMPAAGSFVGGDIMAGVMASGMHRKTEISLFVDIGTNVEVVLGNRDWLVACAGAAGPALEGGVAKCGMKAQSGAVESVRIDPSTGRVDYETIGKFPAKGICGSGLIDSLAELFLDGIIDRSGHFQDGRKEYILVPADQSADGKDILVTQEDLDNLMRTKGAVNAAVDLLLESVGLDLSAIDQFYAAGAFGQYLNLESAVAIGIYPDLPRKNMLRIGNSSGEGARMALMSDQKRHEADEIAGEITYFELIAKPEFMNKFVGSMFLPHTNLDYFPSVKKMLLSRKQVS